MNCSTPGLPVHHQLPEFTQTHVHWVGGAIQPPHPLSSPSPPALNLSQHQGLFKWVSSPHQVAEVLEFNFNISPSNEHPGLISFRMDWLDLLAAQGTLKSVLQHHSSKVSIIWHSAFFKFFYFSYQYVRAHTVVFPPTSRLCLPVFQQRLTLTPGLQQESLTLERACHLFPQTPGRNEVDNLVF